MRVAMLLLVLPLALVGCRPQPLPLDRRVPVDLIGDCVALRQRLSECGEDAVPVLLRRRAASRPELVARLGEEAARAEVRADIRREAALPPEERARQCRVATAETPPPEPEDVARLHRCLALSCPQRAECLGPLLVPPPPSAPPPPGEAPRSPLG
jgi:hypothetical protein